MGGSMDGRAPRKVIVAGGGIPGLSLALALRQAHGESLDVAVFDPGLDRAALRHRGRAFAVAAGGRRMLTRLGVWDDIAHATEPILDMAISDSRLTDPVRPIFLTFGGHGADDGAEAGEPFAHMAEAEFLVESLLSASRACGVVLEPVGIRHAQARGSGIAVALSDGREAIASLLVAADGSRSRLREAAGIGWVGRSYPQMGIVATIGHERPHGGRAFEHFLPSGPFAILPLVDGGALGHRSSIVWTERTSDVEALIGGSREETLAEIERRFGLNLGRLVLEDGPSAHPLSLGMARSFRGERLALLGDAAHVIHPIAGQGLNLGLADAASLAEEITEALRLGLDPGAKDVLQRYERSRRFDTFAMAAATDGLNRLFSNDVLPVRLVRDLGLGLVDRLPGLKSLFIGEASASRAASPRLMRGEAL
ncbi:FAD-dependent monooxygenase [Methylobacterium sp. SD274]|uniref:FAD-dependent monooxygenase n=1 Tax=Methylobacterium sp. SD274 TaxID=2782009 RepID=UPI001A96AC2C|nr:FAD-dependent monooxygenase [Methylobacterium sp. SD274]MBO1021269.1 FAD-dependent monooxygenase [Methylobacterium sp. SD274]